MIKNIFNAVDSASKDGIAIEALIQAEIQFMNNDYDKKELVEALGHDDGFIKMAYKDDDGYWRVTNSNCKYSFEELSRLYPGLC
jgi:hypothetical protein